MKKLALVLAFLMILPGAAFGLEMMNNTSMDEVTGQSGVEITMDDVQIFMNIDRIAWLDCDGYECCDDSTATGGPGALGISNFQLDVLKINAPDTAVAKSGGVWDLSNGNDCSQIGLQFNYGDTTTTGTCSLAAASGGTQTLGLNNYTSVGDPLGSGRYIPQALVINATNQLPILTHGMETVLQTTGSSANTGGVLICIPTLEINIPTLSLTPAFYNVADASSAHNSHAAGADFGTIVLDGITVTTLSGWLEIAPL